MEDSWLELDADRLKTLELVLNVNRLKTLELALNANILKPFSDVGGMFSPEAVICPLVLGQGSCFSPPTLSPEAVICLV